MIAREVNRRTGTDPMIRTMTGKGSETATGNVIGIVIEVVGIEGEGQIGDPGMEEMGAGTGTETGAGQDPLEGMGTGGHLGVRFTNVLDLVVR